jgi:hypothetical protein
MYLPVPLNFLFAKNHVQKKNRAAIERRRRQFARAPRANLDGGEFERRRISNLEKINKNKELNRL